MFFFFNLKIRACVFYTFFIVHSFFLIKVPDIVLLMDFYLFFVIFVIFTLKWNVH